MKSTRGQRVADKIASAVGSWRFIIIQNCAIFAWMVWGLLPVPHLDPFPFLFLNIVMSWQAANSAPVLQMSQNRQAQKDREQQNSIEENTRITRDAVARVESVEGKLDDHIGQQNSRLDMQDTKLALILHALNIPSE